jgi:hypothetical protein
MKKLIFIFFVLINSILTLFSQEDNQLPNFQIFNQEPKDFDHDFFKKENLAELRIAKITVESSLKSYEYNMHSGYVSDMYKNTSEFYFNKARLIDSVLTFKNNNLIALKYWQYDSMQRLVRNFNYGEKMERVDSINYYYDSLNRLIREVSNRNDEIKNEKMYKWKGDTCITYYVISDTFLLSEGYYVFDDSKRKIAAGRYDKTEDKFEKGITYKYVFKDNLLKEIINESYENQSFAIMRSTYFDYKLDKKGRVIEQTDRYNYIKNFFFENDRLVKMIHKDLKSDSVYTKIYSY